MPAHSFTIHDDNGPEPEELGGMELADDTEAFAFGKHVIQVMPQRDAKRYAGWTMDITEGTRAVGSLLFYFYVSPTQKTDG